MQHLDDAGLAAKTDELRKRVADGETVDDVLPEAFAVCREAARRRLGMRHFDVQLIGGMVLHEGTIAEMATGEGKTLVATLPAYLNALTGHGRAHRHGQRLPGQARRPVDGADLPGAGTQRGRHPARGLVHLRSGLRHLRHPDDRAATDRAARGLPLRHHVRHQQRVRLRLPARQHALLARGAGPAPAALRDRRRGGLDPHRRGAHAADHLRARPTRPPISTSGSTGSSPS